MVSGLINKSDAEEISGGAKSMQVVGQFQRAALAISRMNGACRNLIFMAARGGSGTSTSALHIARHLRELGANPLLVELNRFNPSLTATLKLPEVSGVLAVAKGKPLDEAIDRKSTRLNSSHSTLSRMPSSA